MTGKRQQRTIVVLLLLFVCSFFLLLRLVNRTGAVVNPFIYVEDLEPNTIVEYTRTEKEIVKMIERSDERMEKSARGKTTVTITFPVIDSTSVESLGRVESMMDKLATEIKLADQPFQHHLFVPHANHIEFKVVVFYDEDDRATQAIDRLRSMYREVRFQSVPPLTDDLDDLADAPNGTPTERDNNVLKLIDSFAFNKPTNHSRIETLRLVSTLNALEKENLGETEDNPQYIYIMNSIPSNQVCEQSLSVLDYIITKANTYNEKWKIIKLSQSWKGFLMRAKDTDSLSKYLFGNRHIKKYHHLIDEWLCGMSRTGLYRRSECPHRNNNLFIFTLNLFQESHSSGCWNTYIKSRKCRFDDMIPCINYSPSEPVKVTSTHTSLFYFTHFLNTKLVSFHETSIHFQKKPSPNIISEIPLLVKKEITTKSNSSEIPYIAFIIIIVIFFLLYLKYNKIQIRSL